MRKILFVALAAFALFSCEKEQDLMVEKNPQSLKFVFSVADKPSFDADTKAVKGPLSFLRASSFHPAWRERLALPARRIRQSEKR